MQCKRALGLKVSSALVLHTGNVAMFLLGHYCPVVEFSYRRN